MPLRIFTLFFLILSFQKTVGQEVLWASEVLSYSSEKSDVFNSPKYRSVQILGTPSVYPQMADSPCAWEPNGSQYGEDYVKVGFTKAIDVQQIAIIENLNPGAIARIFGYDEAGTEYLLYQNTGQKTTVKSRFWRVFVKPMKQPINAIKIVVNHRISKGRKQYDAIAISDSQNFIEFNINVAKDIPDDLQKENLGPTVNSPYGEVAPIITPDGNTLYFTRLNHPDNIRDENDKDAEIKQDIWFSKRNIAGVWMPPENLGPPVNDANLNAAATASASGSGLFVLNLYKPGGRQEIGLSRTTFSDGKWSYPEEVRITDFQAKKTEKDKAANTEYAISHDENILVMALNRLPSFGNNDLYVSFKEADGSYSRPKNMGSILNTADNEGSPFLSADNKTLYFNSKGHPGFGDSDIFMTKRLDETWTNWSEPLNLGPKINTERWDAFFTIPASGEFAYLSSDNNSLGGEDIFRINLFKSIKPDAVAILDGSIMEKDVNTIIDTPLGLKSNSDSLNLKGFNIEINPDTKAYKVILPVGFKYYFDINEKGYLSLQDSLDLTREGNYREITKNFHLSPIREGSKMVLENLIFAQGKYEIETSSYDELEKLVKIMKEYPKMRILLEGHTDNQGDFTLNVKLAKDRVDEVRNYLVKKGKISGSRIDTKSWGPIKPISSNSTPETRKKNRRVEFTILKM